MNLIDCHTHTQFSVDSNADIKQMIEKAIELGLSAYAITDHCECNCWYTADHYVNNKTDSYFNYKKDFEDSLTAITSLKDEYDGKINLICGTEMGQATHDYEVAEKIIGDKRLDFVIGSMHQLPDYKDFAFIDYSNYTIDEIHDLLEKYFLEVYKLCKWGKFDVLGHLTYTLRYIEGNAGFKVNMKKYDDIIAESFKSLIQNGKGIEINSSGLRQNYGFTFPTLEYIKLFKDLGGEIISIGSDAHTVEDLGKGIKEATDLALIAGFDKLCYFKKRQPVFIKIQ